MTTSFSSTRGFAVEAVILVGVLIAGGTVFGIREIKHAVKEAEQARAVTDANKAADVAVKDSQHAEQLRDASTQALADEKQKRAQLETDTKALGKTIQRSSAEGGIAVGQLPGSRQRDHLVARFAEIDVASRKLYGDATPQDVQEWKQLALDALAGSTAAQSKLDGQLAEIESLKARLTAAEAAHTAAQHMADTETERANQAQRTATASVLTAQKRTQEAMATFGENATLSSVLTILKVVLCAVAGLWVLGIFLKSFAFGLPGEGQATTAMHNVANGVLSLLSPLSVLGETRARRDTQKLIESTGTFMADVRARGDNLGKAVTEHLDAALSPSHQRRVRAACIADQKQRAADAVPYP